MPRILSPYRGERYHLRDFRGRRRQPQGREELFNYRHSSLRNVIERCFGVLKARFPILKQMPPYPMRTQTYIPIACCTIHNFIKLHAHQDLLFHEFNDELLIIDDDNVQNVGSNTQMSINVRQNEAMLLDQVRDQIADRLWTAFEH